MVKSAVEGLSNNSRGGDPPDWTDQFLRHFTGMGRRPLRAWDHFGQIQYRPPTGDFGHQPGAVRNLYSPHFGNDTHNSANSVFAAVLSLPVLAIVLVYCNRQ